MPGCLVILGLAGAVYAVAVLYFKEWRNPPKGPDAKEPPAK